MKIQMHTNDESVLRELGARMCRVRLEHNLTQAALAVQAGVSSRTVERLESGEVAIQLSGFIRVCRALGLLDRFDVLVPEPTVSPIAKLKLQGRERKRASRSKTPAVKSKKWEWGKPS